MNADRREIALHQQLVQLCCSAHTFNKNDNLVEVQGIKEVIQLPVLLQLTQFNIVLPGKRE